MITVKLIKLGEPVLEHVLDESASTVKDLFSQAEKTFVQGNVTRNQSTISPDTRLYNGDRIYIGTAVKGNNDIFDVVFIRLGGTTITLPGQDGYTIKKTLEQQSEAEKNNFYRADGSVAYEFRIGNGRPVDENYVLNTPTSGNSIRVICAQRIKGN